MSPTGRHQQMFYGARVVAQDRPLAHAEAASFRDDDAAGFERVDYSNLTGGVVAIHRGYRF